MKLINDNYYFPSRCLIRKCYHSSTGFDKEFIVPPLLSQGLYQPLQGLVSLSVLKDLTFRHIALLDADPLNLIQLPASHGIDILTLRIAV